MSLDTYVKTFSDERRRVTIAVCVPHAYMYLVLQKTEATIRIGRANKIQTQLVL